jgi:transcription initiation factor TFIIIB Brf1 subunit/transcription initiation factor TFIIB
MFKWFKKLLKRINSTVGYSGYTDKKVKCPECKGTNWYEGPSGGASMNIICSTCGTVCNYGPFSDSVEKVGVNQEIKSEYLKSLRDKKLNSVLKK